MDLNRILFLLKDKYPRYDILFRKTKQDLIGLFVEEKKLFEFNPELITGDLSFLESNPDYEKIIFKVFDDKVIPFDKVRSRGIRRGLGSKGLSLQQVQDAVHNTKSNDAAARWARVGYRTWKKYSSRYFHEDGRSYFEEHLNIRGLGVSRPKGFIQLGPEKVFSSSALKFPEWKFRRRLIKYGYMIEKCYLCGLSEHRFGDERMPLLLDYLDGNKQNRVPENLRLLCYNCYFYNVGDLFWKTPNSPSSKKLEKQLKQLNCIGISK